jgi:hypothetical protein
LHAGKAKLDPKGPTVALSRPGGADPALTLNGASLASALRGSPEKIQMISTVGGLGKIQVLRRATPGAFAILPVSAQLCSAGLIAAPAAVIGAEKWDRAAVYRARIDSSTGRRTVENLALKATRDGNTIRLSDPVDSSVFGSPIVTPDGVIGIVEDERTGIFLRAEGSAGPHP